MTREYAELVLKRFGMTLYLFRRGRGDVVASGTMYYKARPGEWSISRTPYGLVLLYGGRRGEWVRKYLEV